MVFDIMTLFPELVDSGEKIAQLKGELCEELGNAEYIKADLADPASVAMLAEKCGIAAVFSGNDENGYKYAITSRTEDVRAIGKELNSVCNGRGGGKPDMVQGSVAATKAQIEEFRNKI